MNINGLPTEQTSLIPPAKSKAFYCIRMHIEKYSDLYQDLVVLAFTINFFASELFVKSYPPWLLNASYSAMEFVGLIGLNFQASLLSKFCGDSYIAWYGHDWLMFPASLVKSTYAGSGIVLTLSGITAAIFRQFGRMDITNRIYTITRPWGLSLVGVGAIKTIFNLAMNRWLIKRIGNWDPSHTETSIDILRSEARGVDREAYKLEGIKNVVRIRCQMDKDMVRTTRKTVNEISADAHEGFIKAVALENIKTQYKVGWAHLGLKIYGDVLMGISDLKPGTLFDASSRLAASVVYTTVMIWRKVKQHFQRKQAHLMNDISLS